MEDNKLKALKSGTFEALMSLQWLYVESTIPIAIVFASCEYSVKVVWLMLVGVGTMLQ